MNRIVLPQQLQIKTSPAENVSVYNYAHTAAKEKVKIKLTQNVFSFLQSGTKKIIAPSEQVHITDDQFILLKSGNCLVSEHLSSNNNYKAVLLFFSDDVLFNLMQKLKVKLTAKTNNENFTVFNYDNYAVDYAASLTILNNIKAPLKQQILLARFEELFTYLIGVNGPAFVQKIFTAESDNHKKLLTSVVENNMHKNLTIDELAFLCNRSASALKRDFKKYFDESPFKWMQSKKLEYASYLIEYEHMQASNIYAKVGYESLSAFIQAYKRRFGTTPKKHFVEN